MAIQYGFSTGYPSSYTTAVRDDYYQRIRAMGATKVRFDVDAAGAGDLFELHITSAVSAGLKVRAMVGIASTMSGATYAAKCTSIANKYRTVPGVVQYEMGNEPNINGWADGVTYAAVAKAGADAVKASYAAASLPNPEIVLGGMAPNGTPLTWLTSVYTLGAGHAWFDSVDFHPYGYWRNFTGLQAFQNAQCWPVLADTSPSIRSIMIANGDGSKPLHVGEHGGPTWSDGITSTDYLATSGDTYGMTEQAVADFIQLSIADYQTNAWAGDMLLYSFRDRAPDQFSGSREGHFGQVHNNYTNKPGYQVVVNGFAAAASPPQTITTDTNAIGPIVGAQQIVTDTNAIGPITTDTTPPTVSLTAPATGGVSGNVTISATAADNVAVAQVEFLVDGLVVGTDTTSPYSTSWNSALAVNGAHTITARATDTSGNQTTSSPVAVTVSGGIASTVGLPHKAEPFPALTFEVDFAHDTLAVPYGAQVLATSGVDPLHPLPTAYYQLREASGTSGAEAQGKTAGSYVGTITYHVASPVAADDYAVTLGSGGVFAAGVSYSATVTDLTPVGITICGWFKAAAIPNPNTSGYYKLITTTNSNAVDLSLGGDGLLWITRSDSTSSPAKGTTVIQAGEWFFAALAITGTTIPTLPDGSPDPNADPVGFASAYLMKLSDLVIRKEVTAGQRVVDQWAGAAPRFGANGLSIDEPAYWTGVLTQTQIADIAGHANPTGFVYPGYTWTDLSAPLRGSASTSRGRQRETEQAAAGSATVTLKDTTRRLEPGFAASDLAPNVAPLRFCRLRATLAATTYDLLRFYVQDWPTDWNLRSGIVNLGGPDLLGVLGTWPLAGAFVQQLTGARINAILDRIGWPAAARAIDTGVQTVAKETVTGQNALSYLQLIADSDNGLFFIDGAGNAVFHDGAHRATAARSIAPQAVFGDGGPGTSELPYVGSPGFLKPADQIWNQVTVSYGLKDQTVTVSDYVSQRRGLRALPTRETRLVNATAALALANTLLARFKDPPERFTSVTIDPRRFPGLWAAALGLEVGDRVTVKRGPAPGGAVVSKDCWIESVAHSIQLDSPQSWSTTFQLTTV